jgi:hypothetical protein
MSSPSAPCTPEWTIALRSLESTLAPGSQLVPGSLLAQRSLESTR